MSGHVVAGSSSPETCPAGNNTRFVCRRNSIVFRAQGSVKRSRQIRSSLDPARLHCACPVCMHLHGTGGFCSSTVLPHCMAFSVSSSLRPRARGICTSCRKFSSAGQWVQMLHPTLYLKGGQVLLVVPPETQLLSSVSIPVAWA